MKNLLKFTVFVFLFVLPASVTASPLQSQQKSSAERKAEELDTDELFAVVEFSGNRAFSSEELEEVLNPQNTLLSFYKLGKSPLPLPEGIQNVKDHLERLRFFLGTKGYLRAKIGEPQVEKLSEQMVKVRVPIEEGACYRIGNIAITGAKAISFGELVEISGLRYGEPINAAAIQEKIFTGIKNEYADRGFIQASVDFLPEFKLAYPTAIEGWVDVTVEVDEGRLFTIESIGFSRFATIDEQAVRNLLLIQEGQPYSRQKLNETLNRLNQLGIFEEIKNKDVITRISDRGTLVKLEFLIKELSPQR